MATTQTENAVVPPCPGFHILGFQLHSVNHAPEADDPPSDLGSEDQ